MIENYHNEPRPVDVDKAWDKLYSRMQENHLITHSISARKFLSSPTFLWLAAAVLALALTTIAIRLFIPERQKMPLLSMRNYDRDNTLVKTLEDGSTVYLGTSSFLFYPERFAADSRKVEMQGNALFDIARNPQKPFRIETGKVTVEVLGTAFNIQSDGKKTFLLNVLRGKVKLTQKTSGESIIVLAGEEAKMVDSHWVKSRSDNRDLLLSFVKNMRFKDEPLDKIVNVINQYSIRKIALKTEAIKSRKLNVRFYNNDVDGITKVISMALHLKREVTPDSIFISQP